MNAKKKHVVAPATATEIRRRLRISKKQISNVKSAFKRAGIKV